MRRLTTSRGVTTGATAGKSGKQVKTIKLKHLTQDNLNANQGTARGAGMIERSLSKHGAGRSILVDKQGRIIAGNKTHQAAAEIGLSEDAVLVETDGTQLVVVKRTDIDLDSPEGRALAIADNRAAQVGLDWNIDALAEIAQDVDLSEYWFEGEIDIPDIALSDEISDSSFPEMASEVSMYTRTFNLNREQKEALDLAMESADGASSAERLHCILKAFNDEA